MYTHGQRQLTIGVPGTPIPTQTPAIKGASTCPVLMRPVEVQAICALITTAMTVTAAVIDIKYRPIPGSASGEVVLGRLTLPVSGSTIGDLVYKKVAPVKCGPGGEIVADLVTASTAGAAIFGVVANETTEHPSNSAIMKESA